MAKTLDPTALIPAGFIVEEVISEAERWVVRVRSAARFSNCPCCSQPSTRVHSHYQRRPLDLPSSGRLVQLEIMARKFRCAVSDCKRRVFAERFTVGSIKSFSRRTERLDLIVHHLGLALGGRPGASFARRLMLPVSNDTLLRVVRRRALPRTEPLTAVGIDDWAFRRNHRYGTIVCDLERRHIVTLLPDRERATVQAWLANHPGIKIVSRDRGAGYGEATAKALPNAVQVADRWHLMENASAAFLNAVRKSMRPIRSVIGATTINPDLLTCAERLQYEGFQRREETNASILALARDGVPIKQIACRTGHSRGMIRQVVRGQRTDIFRTRESSLDPHLPLLDAQWASGSRNGAALWRHLKLKGYCGSIRVVGEWATRRRRAEKASDRQLHKVPSARSIARLMTTARDHLSKADTVTIAAIETGVPALVEARTLVMRFHIMVRQKAEADLEPWITDAAPSLIASFTSGITNDLAAVRAAITEPWSNGQVEGQVNKLKLVKRQMYGRAKIDLLQARLIGAA